MVVVGDSGALGGEENGALLFDKYEFSVWENEKVLEMKGGDGCTAM